MPEAPSLRSNRALRIGPGGYAMTPLHKHDYAVEYVAVLRLCIGFRSQRPTSCGLPSCTTFKSKLYTADEPMHVCTYIRFQPPPQSLQIPGSYVRKCLDATSASSSLEVHIRSMKKFCVIPNTCCVYCNSTCTVFRGCIKSSYVYIFWV